MAARSGMFFSECMSLLSGTFSVGEADGGFWAAEAAVMGLTRGSITRTETSGVASCGFEGAFVTRVSRAGACDGFGSCTTADETGTGLSRGCGVGVSLDHGEVDDMTLSARGSRGIGSAVGITVGFTMRYSFFSWST